MLRRSQRRRQVELFAMKVFAGLLLSLFMPPLPGLAEEAFRIHGDAAKGAGLFKMHCASCHGETGSGEGVCASVLKTKPRALSDKAYMETLSDHHLYTVIKDGGEAVGKSAVMAAWGDALGTDQAVHDVAAYVRSLAE